MYYFANFHEPNVGTIFTGWHVNSCLVFCFSFLFNFPSVPLPKDKLPVWTFSSENNNSRRGQWHWCFETFTSKLSERELAWNPATEKGPNDDHILTQSPKSRQNVCEIQCKSENMLRNLSECGPWCSARSTCEVEEACPAILVGGLFVVFSLSWDDERTGVVIICYYRDRLPNQPESAWANEGLKYWRRSNLKVDASHQFEYVWCSGLFTV